jgi:Phage integrase, N-terminal SAM-like domain/Phage integrase family
MGTDFDGDHRGAPPESLAESFRNALGLRGRPDSKFKWYLIWARRFAAYLVDRPIHLATHDDAEGFLTTLASSPRISGWQVEQATDALTILLGSVFGQEWARTIRIPDTPPPPGIPLPKGDEPAERLRYAIRCRRYSVHTEESYVFWVNRFLAFCRDGGVEQDADSVRAFLEHLVMSERMSASTQGLALNALVFHFKHVVGAPIGDLGEFQRSKRPRKLPVVLGREEVRRLLEAVNDAYRLPLALLYGGGMRLMEALRLRVKDIDLDRRQISVRDGKGQKDRVTILPDRWRERLAAHLAEVRKTHVRDLELCYAGTTFWPALERKYPGAPREWAWQ